MLWDFAEANAFADAAGDYGVSLDSAFQGSHRNPEKGIGVARQSMRPPSFETGCVFSTDPPYYDNIGYADLSDFFYVWLRRSLEFSLSRLFSTLLVPKKQELVATPYRFEGEQGKGAAFLRRWIRAARSSRWKGASQHDYPLTVYYAFKQSESDGDEDGRTGRLRSDRWETMLEGLLTADFQITGTWPMRSELWQSMRSKDRTRSHHLSFSSAAPVWVCANHHAQRFPRFAQKGASARTTQPPER